MADLFHPLADGFRLEGTSGQAVVLVHGFTGVPAHFRPLAAELNADGHTVVVPRLAGHGTSMDDMATTGAADWVRSARHAYEEVAEGHEFIHVGGLSMGGLISILLAHDLPVGSVTTIDSPIVLRDPRAPAASVVARWMPTVTWEEGEEHDLEPEMADLFLTYPGFPTRCLGELNRLSRMALWAARDVAVPALVIQSRADQTVAPVSANLLAACLAGPTELVWLERSMHNATLDRERNLITAAVLSHVRDAVAQ